MLGTETTNAGLGAILKLSERRVATLKAEGRLPLTPAGKIDLAELTRRGWAATLKAEGPPSAPPAAPTRAIVPALSFNEARAVNENLKAARLKLELAELDGRLIDRHKVVALVQELAQGERDAILAWPSRAAALLAAELGIDQHVLHFALDASLRSHLSKRSAIALAV